MKDPRRRSSGAKPHIFLPEGRNACSARRESAFARQGSRHTLDGDGSPGRTVAGRDQRKLAIYRVAERDAMFAVPEGKAVIERLGIFVGELELPVLAAIGRLIDA